MILGAIVIVAGLLLTLLLSGMYLLFFLAGATGGLWMFLSGIRRMRHIRDIPLSRLRSAAQGYVALQGKCLPLKETTVLKGPLSAKPCVWYQFAVFRRSKPDGDAPWTPVRHGTSHIPFVLDDGSGRCIVVPQGATTRVPQAETWYGDRDTAKPGSRTALRSATFKFVEARLEPGMTVYLHGEFTSRPPDPSNAATDILNAWKMKSAEMLARFDSNDDGQLDAQELRNALQAARVEARAELDRILAGNLLNLFGQPADPDRPYVITTRPPQTQVLMLRLQTWLGAAAFLACGAGLLLYWQRGIWPG